MEKPRTFRSVSLLVWFLFMQSDLSAQAGFMAGVDLAIERVQGNVYMIQRPGGGGNIGAFIGPDGILLVDSLFAPMTASLVEAIREVSDGDIRFLMNTHIHGDHVGGNSNLAGLGVLIFAHENTRDKFLEDKSHYPRSGGSFAPQQPEAARPIVTYKDELTFYLNSEEVRAFLAPPAHTDGDTFVYFSESNVLHLGDVFRTTSYPIIDKFNGGTLRGTIAALDLALNLADPDTKVIPGHGLEVVGILKVEEFRDMIVDIRNEVYKMIREGMHLDEIIAAEPTAPYDGAWENDPGWTSNDFIPVVYYELGGGGRLEDR